jgi:small subunit ribosomal protein S16
MATKIRLQRHGAKKRPFYFIVVANSTSRRDGKFIEKLGTYNPLTIPATIELNRDRALHWLDNGAVPTDTANRILSFKGVKFLKHLMRGVKLGLFDEKTALEKFDKWNEGHEKTVSERREGHKKSKSDAKAAVEAVVVKRVEDANSAKEAAAKEVADAAAAAAALEAAAAEEAAAVEAIARAAEEAAPVAEEAATEAPAADAPAAE